jgi:hypothetical protein
MYGGKVGDDTFKSHTKEIINAADKYGVVNLKLEAEVYLVEATTFSLDNVMDHLPYAESKNCALLKEAAMDLIAEHRIKAMKMISLRDVPGTLMSDLAAVVRKDYNITSGGDNENELIMIRICELRREARLKRLNVDGSKGLLIVSFN